MAMHKLIPASKDYLWGGTKLIEQYGKQTNDKIMAESWEVSSHPDGPSILGDLNISLPEYVDKYGIEVTGTNSDRFNDFPILIKFIDAKDVLSIQVHPDDAYALKHEGQFGKNEMWYILEAEPGATIYYGVKKDLTKDEFRDAIEKDYILDVLNKVEVKPGDVIYVKAETIHAIGKGIVLCEIQQNSNVTYRVYDFNRKDKDGNLRDLHIEESIAVSNLKQTEIDFSPQDKLETFNGYTRQTLVQSPYFITTHYQVETDVSFEVDDKSFVSLICLDGQLIVKNDYQTIEIKKGESLFVDANSGLVKVVGIGSFLHVSV